MGSKPFSRRSKAVSSSVPISKPPTPLQRLVALESVVCDNVWGKLNLAGFGDLRGGV